MSNNHQHQTKKAFTPNLGFFKTGAIAGTILSLTSHSQPGISLLAGLVLPTIGGKTMDEKASLAIGEVIGFFLLPSLPNLALTFAGAHPIATAGMIGATTCYYYSDSIKNQISENIIEPIGNLLFPVEGELYIH
jgi:hypothetical protein